MINITVDFSRWNSKVITKVTKARKNEMLKNDFQGTSISIHALK